MSQNEQLALAVGGAGLLFGLIALVWVIVLHRRLGRIRRAQRVVLGETGERDLALHAADLSRQVEEMTEFVRQAVAQSQQAIAHAEQRLDGAITHSGLVRYDAYNEMSGRQSTSIALLDSRKTGVVLSSIHHRDQARLYAKGVRAGVGELELSPEEAEAVRVAIGD